LSSIGGNRSEPREKHRGEEGAWDLCWDFWDKQTPCVVYSYGLADDSSFDQHIAELGCTVHSFDPTINWIPQNKKITFHKTGLSDVDSDSFWGTPMGGSVPELWQVRTLSTTMQTLGHNQLHYLKFDVEVSFCFLCYSVNGRKIEKQLGFGMGSTAKYDRNWNSCQSTAIGF